MITLKGFLTIANNPVIIMDGATEVLIIGYNYFDHGLLSEKLLNMTVATVDAKDKRLLVELEEDV